LENLTPTPPPNQSRRRFRPGLAIALLLAVAVVAVLLVASLRARQAAQERVGLHRLWQFNAVVLFEGEEVYVNPRMTPSEWSAELGRSWLDDLTAPRPTDVVFVRFGPAVRWTEPIVDDGDIPELIGLLRALPTITQVRLDKNFTPAGRATLEKALPDVHFSKPLTIP